ncbi:MAG: DNA-directed RNA polymerase subunit alpha C-terminal domain-containing protein [Planctomycetota bacterium]|nr:DNA-directed RNA polymerase subunit alpha C-terminal domain-containing protein [Planctomycetota bacterium]
MDNQDVSPEQPGANAPQPAATQPAAPEPTGQPGVEHDSVSGLSEAGHTDLQEHREAEGSAEASADTMAAPMEAYHSPEPEEEEEIEPVSAHAPFDLLEDELPSFGALLAARPSVFENPKTFESFDRQVDTLETTGEVGRRRGLGLWMLGRYDEAAEALAPFADDDVACYTRGRSLVSAGRSAEAVAIFQSLSSKYPEESRPLGDMLDAQLDANLAGGDVEGAIAATEQTVSDQTEAFRSSAEGLHLLGRLCELSGDYNQAIEHFVASRGADPTHRRNLFRLAYLSERVGQEQLALDAYETLASMLPVDRAVMVNLGVLYEDLGQDQDAAACYDTIVRTDRTDRFARLYLKDAKAGMSMFYDEDLEKKEDRLNQILRIPITDFELSVRARNCLNKMDIMTLGDLVKKTESELLSYKNFGETSLTEIKEILASKGLRLGMAREEAVASIAKARTAQEGRDLDPNDPRNKPISDLKLSIRARRTVENIGCLTLGDVTVHSEEELLGMPNFGVTSLLELRNRLAEYNLTLKGED